ncbi:fungal-specific transcription factor domain-containing protein [Schizothecium vesticola]|uniref:Fungal-specific transcription factor domain-containing protein n=1 Tax=Schizothecium vesticola TaxID=314040 RepID=A0AA40F4E3_9PEZI|nr:fungal-specific transcription factor domain-containing protein [Schizothecium vesticola]
MRIGTVPKTGSRCAARAIPGARATGIAASSAAATLACGPAMETRGATPPRQPLTAISTGKSRSETSRPSLALSASSGRPRYLISCPVMISGPIRAGRRRFLAAPGMSDACPAPIDHKVIIILFLLFFARYNSWSIPCDRGRPHCLACIKRQTECSYAPVANLLEETNRSTTNGRRMTKAPKKKLGIQRPTLPAVADRGFSSNRPNPLNSIAIATSTGLLSNVPYSSSGSSNLFGVGSEHPFANYWTCEGGLPEVISVLPDKLQADILLSRYFECVDPVYPMLHRQTFYADYEHFWSLSLPEKHQTEAAFVALIFVMLALGTQFVTSTSARERKETAEFYASASNQALRMSSYLSSASLRSIQAMVLITYFLINDDHASDGWAFGGILMRQAYAMGLHRDPNIVTPDATLFEKQQRRKVWQAVLLQDTFLTVLLSLPPSATHTDVSVDDLVSDTSSIASDDPTDTAYVRGSWTLANLVQEAICSPRSLDVPLCATARHKSKLVADFRAVYRAFPDVFRSWDADALARLAQSNKRVVRQTLFLSSNYFHNLMLVHASEGQEVAVNVRGTLEAAHDAMTAFFVLFALFEAEARVWWVFNHRAFLEAMCVGNVLREAARTPGGDEVAGRDPLFVRARGDILRMVQIMQLMSDGEQGSETARTRVQVLSEFLQ